MAYSGAQGESILAPKGPPHRPAFSVLVQFPAWDSVPIVSPARHAASGVSHTDGALFSVVRARRTFLRISSAVLVHTIGFGSSLWFSMYSMIASMS